MEPSGYRGESLGQELEISPGRGDIVVLDGKGNQVAVPVGQKKEFPVMADLAGCISWRPQGPQSDNVLVTTKQRMLRQGTNYVEVNNEFGGRITFSCYLQQEEGGIHETYSAFVNLAWSHIKVYGGVNNGKVFLSTTSDGSKVDLWHSDDGSGRQRWLLIPGSGGWYNIKVYGGVNNGKVFLSTTSDGGKVDLWHSDDGSGRQRWLLIPGSGGCYNIKVYGGVNNGKAFLSTTSDGGKVDLYHSDDGSGRQRWTGVQALPNFGNAAGSVSVPPRSLPARQGPDLSAIHGYLQEERPMRNVCLAGGAAVVLYSFTQVISISTIFESKMRYVVSWYLLLFGLVTCLTEVDASGPFSVAEKTQGWVHNWARGLEHLWGRGFFYLFQGTLMLGLSQPPGVGSLVGAFMCVVGALCLHKWGTSSEFGPQVTEEWIRLAPDGRL